MGGRKGQEIQVRTGFCYYPVGSLSRGYGIVYNLKTRRIIKSKCYGVNGKRMTPREWQSYIEESLGDTVIEINNGAYYIMPEVTL